MGALLTWPLEVVKTWLQSSSVVLSTSEGQLILAGASVDRVVSSGPLHCLKGEHSIHEFFVADLP